MATNNIQGLDILLKQINKIAADVEAKIDKVNRETAEAIATDAKSFAPVKSGRLKNSIHVVKDAAGYEVVADAPYAAKVELGVRGSVAKPFLFPAYQLHKNKFLTNIREAINNIK
ncbi:HK97 gp10 family phage protein [Hymenobacter sp. NBH84]|uniref:HK97-gp10 family putative phage morphogenesis protein n=1 Tax=Hymenobacter sp. NBH84 TaxID=2596915 RepID=UPI001626CD3B|nr:HK97-gp10 family putative phage morphogenesis protein [Hymenobacter sp. NBH84]QNE38990.1 HK97 gp10 family phage protein [Hymenobacter sp. NBH84]